jgi:hypothetical protein
MLDANQAWSVRVINTQPAADRSIWLWRAPGLHVRVNLSSLYSRLILAAGCVQCLAAGADFWDF